MICKWVGRGQKTTILQHMGQNFILFHCSSSWKNRKFLLAHSAPAEVESFTRLRPDGLFCKLPPGIWGRVSQGGESYSRDASNSSEIERRAAIFWCHWQQNPSCFTSFCTPSHWHQHPSCFDQFGGSKSCHSFAALRYA